MSDGGGKRNFLLAKWRILACCFICILPLLLLIARLWQVQIVHGDEYAARVRRQATRFIVTPPVRGQIYSSDGKILAGNRSHYDLTLNPSEMRTRGGFVTTSSYMLNVMTFVGENLVRRDNEIDIVSLRRDVRRNMAQPVVIYKDLTDVELARCMEHTPPIRGLSVTQRIEREYPFPGVATHILGYTGWRNRKLQYTSEHGRHNTFNTRELLGNSGLEKQYDSLLSGRTGFRIVLMDSLGYVRDELPGGTEPEDGMDLVLTLDSKAQQAADKALTGYTGALVALNVKDGSIIACASAPTFNLAEFNSKLYDELLHDEVGRPMLNRAVSGGYMPGSIVKPLVALAALESGTCKADTTFDCTGAFTLGNARIRCARTYGHGELDLVQAIAVSCNPYFINAGLKAGLPELQRFYEAAGFGKSTECDFHAPRAGTIPSQLTARKLWGRKWLPIDTAFASLGQGAVVVTPLQAAVYAAALANGGTVWRPFVIKEVRSKEGQIMRRTMPMKRSEIPASKSNMELVRAAMASAVEEDGASAAAMEAAGFRVAAKTGTAEVGHGENRYKNTWLICYGPLPEPTFAVACIIEKGDSGGGTTAPVVVDFLRGWFGDGGVK